MGEGILLPCFMGSRQNVLVDERKKIDEWSSEIVLLCCFRERGGEG